MNISAELVVEKRMGGCVQQHTIDEDKGTNAIAVAMPVTNHAPIALARPYTNRSLGQEMTGFSCKGYKQELILRVMESVEHQKMSGCQTSKFVVLRVEASGVKESWSEVISN